MTQKRAGKYPKLYTGELSLETLPELKAALKPYFDSGYSQIHMTEILKNIDRAID